MVYLDVVMLYNFIVDFLLLVGANCLSGFPAGILRASCAALIGSIYASACLLPGFHFLGSMLWRCVALLVMGPVAYGLQRSAIRRTILFIFLSMALYGITVGLGNGGFFSVVSAAAGVCGMCILGFGGKLQGAKFVPVTVRSKHTTVQLTALVDTGNTLRDPVSGESVMVLDADTAYRLSGLTRQQLTRPVETIASGAVPGLRLIPFRSVGQSSGMLLALRMEEVKIQKRRAGTLVAFAPDALSGAGGYQALTGGEA